MPSLGRRIGGRSAKLEFEPLEFACNGYVFSETINFPNTAHVSAKHRPQQGHLLGSIKDCFGGIAAAHISSFMRNGFAHILTSFL
jgi:hypothetical protein